MKPHTVQSEIAEAQRAITDTERSIYRYQTLAVWWFMAFLAACIWIFALLMF